MGEHPIEILWRKVGLPEYFLGNSGSNEKLYALYDEIMSSALGRHFHFHPPEGSVLSAVGDAVLIEPIKSAAARLAAGVSVQTVAAGTVNAEAEAILSMLMLTGELGGKREDETCSAYLRRLLDFVASHDPGHYDDEVTVKASDFVDVKIREMQCTAMPENVLLVDERTIGADGKIMPQKPERPLDLADLG
jgi:hypothetical protein